MPVPSETVGEEEGDSADSGHGPGLPRPPDSGAHAFARTPCLGVVRRGNAWGYDRPPHGAARDRRVGTHGLRPYPTPTRGSAEDGP